MVKENKYSPMEINLKANTKMGDQTDEENMSGLMEVLIKVSLKTDIDKV
jgi:hypothetical protein